MPSTVSCISDSWLTDAGAALGGLHEGFFNSSTVFCNWIVRNLELSQVILILDFSYGFLHLAKTILCTRVMISNGAGNPVTFACCVEFELSMLSRNRFDSQIANDGETPSRSFFHAVIHTRMPFRMAVLTSSAFKYSLHPRRVAEFKEVQADVECLSPWTHLDMLAV